MKQTNVVELGVNRNLRVHITQKVLSDIKPRMNTYYVRDSKLIGFAIKVNPKGQAKYIAESRLGGSGRNKRHEVGVVGVISLSNARKKAREIISAIQSGIDPREGSSKSNLTLRLLVERYYKTNQRIKPGRVNEYINDVITFMSPLLNRDASDISAEEYLAYFQKNVRKRPTRTDRVHRQVKAVYNYAIDKKLVKENPTDIVTTHDRPVIKPRERSLSLDLELPKFLTALVGVDISQTVKDALWLILCTGMRKTEALSLRWKEVDFFRYILLLQDTKNKNSHMIPMSNLIRSILVKRFNSPDRDENFVFPNAIGSGAISDIRKSMQKILEVAEINDSVAPHDLRRTFTAIGQYHGLEIYEIKALLNHVDGSVTEKHYTDKTSPTLIKKRRTLLNRFSEYLEKMATGYPNGIRYGFYLEGLFEEERDPEGVVSYKYQMEKNELERKLNRSGLGLELTHEDVKQQAPEIYALRNEGLERAYDQWEMF